MSNKDDNNIFLKSLDGVKPLKKNNQFIKPIPKLIKLDRTRTVLKEIENDKIHAKVKKFEKKIIVKLQRLAEQIKQELIGLKLDASL